jgi:putative sigma-54 modulation protein
MNISSTARHYDLAPALKDYAEEKVVNLKKYFDHIVTAHVIFSLEKYRHKVEITLHVNGKDFVSAEESDDMYMSVDRSVDKLERQLRRHKEKVKGRKSNQSLAETAAEAEEQLELKKAEEEGDAL